DSYEICFVRDGDSGSFVDRALGGGVPGAFEDEKGDVVGEHSGIHRYTVGQRRGLGLATAEKRYVLEVDASRNAIVVGPEELLSRAGLEAEDARWFGEEPPAGSEVTVQIRAHGEEIPARLEACAGGRIRVRFVEPQRAIAPGQLVGFYSG